MTLLFSASAGLVLHESNSASKPLISFFGDGEVCSLETARPLLSLIDDWQVVTAASEEDALKKAKESTNVEYLKSLVLSSLRLKKMDMVGWAMSEVEEHLEGGDSAEKLCSKLLVAPVEDVSAWERLKASCIEYGCPSVLAVVTDVVECQPQLRRFVDGWLSVPDSYFNKFGKHRSELWLDFVREGHILGFVKSYNKNSLNTRFLTLMFSLSSGEERAALLNISSYMQDYLFSSMESPALAGEELTADSYDESEPLHDERLSGWEVYSQAMRQIEEISNAVFEGRDAQAYKYLDELIDFQKANSDSDEIIKSLCNLAQRSAQMFRSDFEGACLKRALEISENDPWLLVQMGDHYKRTGYFIEAEKTLNKAKAISVDYVAVSALADVYVHEGKFQEAINEYKSVPEWKTLPAIRTAIADTFRKSGDFARAESEYLNIDHDLLGSHRTASGIAQIRKLQGRVDEAIGAYTRIIENYDLDSASLSVYKSALAGLLKQKGSLEAAYKIANEVVESEPFNVGVKCLRASILGLLERDAEAESALPKDTVPKAYGEWFSSYVRGLLLMRTSNFGGAREKFLHNWEAVALEDEGRNALRMAAVVSYLAEDNIDEAGRLLDKVGGVNNQYIVYMHDVLSYHYFIKKRDTKSAAKLLVKLKKKQEEYVDLWSIVESVRDGVIKKEVIINQEVNALLRYAS